MSALVRGHTHTHSHSPSKLRGHRLSKAFFLCSSRAETGISSLTSRLLYFSGFKHIHTQIRVRRFAMEAQAALTHENSNSSTNQCGNVINCASSTRGQCLHLSHCCALFIVSLKRIRFLLVIHLVPKVCICFYQCITLFSAVFWGFVCLFACDALARFRRHQNKQHTHTHTPSRHLPHIATVLSAPSPSAPLASPSAPSTRSPWAGSSATGCPPCAHACICDKIRAAYGMMDGGVRQRY